MHRIEDMPPVVSSSITEEIYMRFLDNYYVPVVGDWAVEKRFLGG